METGSVWLKFHAFLDGIDLDLSHFGFFFDGSHLRYSLGGPDLTIDLGFFHDLHDFQLIFGYFLFIFTSNGCVGA